MPYNINVYLNKRVSCMLGIVLIFTLNENVFFGFLLF